MRILVTADFQAEWINLQQCRQAMRQIESLVVEHKLEAVVIAGDLKAHYDPVQIRVIQFWQNAIRRLRKLGVRVLILLGNHDRIGMYTDNQNWLSILRRAGAETFDTADAAQMSDGEIMMLPFISSVDLFDRVIEDVGKDRWNKQRDVLVFHADVSGCNYNMLGQKSEAKVKIPSRKFLAAIGGHIHLPQKIGDNTYYVGSPFCCDWGEANQRKRFLLVLGDKIKSVPTDAPGWFDETWPGFYQPASWEGAHVRIHVDCEGRKYRRAVEENYAAARERFLGAIIQVVPEFGDDAVSQGALAVSTTDEDAITGFVTDTLPVGLDGRKVIAFLTHKVRAVQRKRRANEVQLKILGVKATNVLSFKSVECSFDKSGLTLVEGVNHDWMNQSNGAGKSNLTNLIPIAWFGTTFKGQKYDAWARQGTKDTATVSLLLEDANRNKIEIQRSRRPSSLKLLVNGKDQSAGMNRSAKEGTQALLDAITGVTWQTLANSVYIDPDVTNAFLRGTKKERADLLYRFQNLERFEVALGLVREAGRKHQASLLYGQAAADVLTGQMDGAREAIETAKEKLKTPATLHEEYRSLLVEWRVLHKKKLLAWKKMKRTQRILEPKFIWIGKELSEAEQRRDKIRNKVSLAERRRWEVKNLIESGACPTCRQSVDKKIFSIITKELDTQIKTLRVKMVAWEKDCHPLMLSHASIEAKIDKTKIDEGAARNLSGMAYDKLRYLKRQIKEQKDQQRVSLDEARAKYRRLKESRNEYNEYVKSLQAEENFFTYCEHALSRDGLPAFIINQLAAPLTKAAADYSSIFSDGEIQVRFKAEGGGIEPEVVNLHGGSSLGDQSVGELSMASVISAFALREVAPKTNLLILDEPGMGMTAYNLKKLAQGLLKLKSRFESIFVITHSPFLSGELQGERVITIEKKNRISRLT